MKVDKNILEVIEERKLKWFGHVTRMGEDRILANSPIHRVYRRYTKFRRTQHIDEMGFFAKENILNVSPTNQLRKC